MNPVKARAEARRPRQSYLSKVDNWAKSCLASQALSQDRAQEFSPGILKALRTAGFLSLELGNCMPDAPMALVHPEEAGLGGVAAAIRGLSRSDPGVAVLVHVHNTLVVRCLMKFGTEPQKAKWLPALAQDRIGAFAATEPQGGSDLSLMTCELRPRKCGGYLLNGNKHWITNAAEAGLFLVLARLGRLTACAIVPAEAEGLTVGDRIRKMSMRASSTCPVQFSDVAVEDDQILGGPGAGMDVAMYGLVNGRIGIAAQMLGLAEGAHRRALSFARSRVAFGANIIDHQGICFPFAQIKAEMSAIHYTLAAAVQTAESTRSHMAALELADTAKLLSAQVANKAAGFAVEVLGGNGVAEDFQVEKLYRDARVGKIYEGTENILLRALATNLESGRTV